MATSENDPIVLLVWLARASLELERAYWSSILINVGKS